MPTTEELLKQAKALNAAKEYDNVISLLTDEILFQYQNADLFAEVALASYRAERKDLGLKYTDFALAIDGMHAKANYYKGVWCREHKDYEKAIVAYKRAITANPELSFAYTGLGHVYRNLNYYEEAIKAYNQAIEIDHNNFASYNGLGNVYAELKNYVDSIESYNKAIEINPKLPHPYNGLGNVYRALKDYDEAFKNYNECIKCNAKYNLVFYNKALIYYDLGRYDEARAHYKQYIALTRDNTDINIQYAKDRIEEIQKILGNSDYRKISELIAKIKELLLHQDGCVTHYTSFSITQKLILEKSQFRLSEGAFLNDTAEGRELFDFLDFHPAPTKNLKDTVAKPFVEKPFIGSFVAETKHDDLALWRMYGKENKEEAKGCAITIDADGLLMSIREKLFPNDKTGTNDSDENLQFYRVVYRAPDDIFIIPGAKEDEAKLNNHMRALISDIKTFNRNIKKLRDKDSRIKDVLELLNSIAYLFKSAEYQYENELRLVVKKGIGFEKQIEHENGQLKVYIELIDISPHIRKITLGPKVERRDEWAAIFYYSLEKAGLKPDIYISHLPFK